MELTVSGVAKLLFVGHSDQNRFGGV